MIKYLSAMLVVCSIFVAPVSADTASLKDMEGQGRTLNEYTGKGKWLVALFWASDCHVCNVEAEQYIQFHEANKDKNVQLLGISLDGQQKLDEAKAFIKRHDVTFPNLIGEFVEVASLYESLTGGEWVGTPTILLFNPKGELKAAQPGAVPVELISQFIESQSVATKPAVNSTK